MNATSGSRCKRAFEVEASPGDADLVAVERARLVERLLDAGLDQSLLQEGDGLLVVPLGHDDHALDAPARHLEHVRRRGS